METFRNEGSDGQRAEVADYKSAGSKGRTGLFGTIAAGGGCAEGMFENPGCHLSSS